MTYHWDDYSGDSGVPGTPLFLSDRSIGLFLSVIRSMQFRFMWDSGVSDFTWNDIEHAISEAIYEISTPMTIDATPTGSIVWFPGLASDIPTKWRKCDGSSLLRADYPDLFLILRSVYPFTSTHFELPDLSNRFLYGSNLDAQVGDTGGTETHTLVLAEMPAHSHNVPSRANAGSTAGVAALSAAASNTNVATDSKGSGSPHNNMPPYIRGYWIIKALP